MTNQNEAIDVRYDASKDESSEYLDYAIFYADIANAIPFRRDKILEILPFCSYQGEKRPNEINVSFRITEYSGTPTIPTNKLVFLIDGEKIEIETYNDHLGKKQRFRFTPESIIGIGRVALPTEMRIMEFSLHKNDIKRIADSTNVCVQLDATTQFDANGGDFNFRNIEGSFKIEGIQGAMKRAYHYFVDENCYADYCASFLERKHKILEEEKLKIEKEKQEQEQQRIQREQQRIQEEQAEQEEIALWRKSRNRTLIILVVSLVFIGIGGSAPFFGFVGFVGGLYSIVKLGLLYSDGTGFGEK